ncbi:ABC transporter ATP-binding protein [Prosthecodimorpha staleyi]|uniref:ABC transporter ATP-binding protein n=1 Tax=Prosthecodimorpha staleyi TaxID=2840188 RepID=A0A947GF62_9HYPH|nr:ABC transporter ATP-binding protein [Prosthecodimorpha staleyi]MBT9292356.1 ABC transporter ATP-binding protein [Prosthecodimorpha staleyi]
MSIDLEVRTVSKRFGRFTAVHDVSLQVPKGSFFSILGPSGCGKTTLMRMIAGFEQPSAGDILINGASVLATPPNRRPVNMVFQHLALFPMMTVAGNVGYGLRRRGLPREEIARKVDAVLARVGLATAGPKRIDQLSGGQKQRVAIARCMVLEPTVLLLDEPLGALDLKLREHMKVELKQLQHQFGTTFVYITHDQSEALVMSDQVAVMNGGRFEQVGTPQDLYYRPSSAFVAGFVGDSQRWTATVTAADAGRIRARTESGLTVAATAAEGVRPTVGTRVEIFVRPEAIVLETAGAQIQPAEDGDNRFSGTVDSLLFNGAASQTLVTVAAPAAPETLAVALPAGLPTGGLAPGAAVRLRFQADRAIAFLAPNGATPHGAAPHDAVPAGAASETSP